MSDYSIGSFGFVRWVGPRPQFITQTVVPYSKPGQDGTSALLLGSYGKTFQVNLTAVFVDEATARTAESTYRSLIGTIQILIYEGTNYRTIYSTDYLVQNVMNTRAKRNAWLVGPTYRYPGGWQVFSQWSLIPSSFIAP